MINFMLEERTDQKISKMYLLCNTLEHHRTEKAYKVRVITVIFVHSKYFRGFPGGSDGKRVCLRYRRPEFNLWVGKILGEGTDNPSGILAWRIPWTEEPGGLQSVGLQRVNAHMG